MSSKDKIKTILTDNRTVVASAITCIVNYLFLTVGVISPAWRSFSRTSVLSVSHFYGLWSECAYVDSGSSYCETWDSSDLSGTFKASQAFGILAFITMTCAVIGVILHVFHDARDFHRFVLLAVFVLFYVSGGLILLGVILFAVATKYTSGITAAWGGNLCAFAGVIALVLGVYFTLLHVIKREQKDDVTSQETDMTPKKSEFPPLPGKKTAVAKNGVDNTRMQTKASQAKTVKLPPIKK